MINAEVCVYKHREWKEMSKEESLSASWEAQQQPRPIVSQLRGDSRSPDPGVIINFKF